MHLQEMWKIIPFKQLGLCTLKVDVTYKKLALVKVFAAPVGVFDFFAEDQGHFKEEEVSVTTLANESLGIPYLE